MFIAKYAYQAGLPAKLAECGGDIYAVPEGAQRSAHGCAIPRSNASVVGPVKKKVKESSLHSLHCAKGKCGFIFSSTRMPQIPDISRFFDTSAYL